MGIDDEQDDLCHTMRALRLDVGQPSLRQLDVLAQRLTRPAGGPLRPQTLSPVLRGERYPSWETVELFVLACEAKARASRLALDEGEFDLDRWHRLWRRRAARTTETAPRMRRRPAPILYNCTGVMTGDHASMLISVRRAEGTSEPNTTIVEIPALPPDRPSDLSEG